MPVEQSKHISFRDRNEPTSETRGIVDQKAIEFKKLKNLEEEIKEKIRFKIAEMHPVARTDRKTILETNKLQQEIKILEEELEDVRNLKSVLDLAVMGERTGRMRQSSGTNFARISE